MKISLECRSIRLQLFHKINVFKDLQNLLENTSARVSFLIKLKAGGLKPAALLKKETPTQVVYSEGCKILKTTYLQNSCERLFLDISEY